LAAEAGIDRIDLILSPVDFRKRDLPAGVPRGAPWIPELYAEIRRALLDLSASSRN
jgi:hypothetical protein